MNIYLIRIEWEDNGHVNSEVILTKQKSMALATKWVTTKFENSIYASGSPHKKEYRITWAENLSPALRDKYGVTIYMHGPFGLHDPFCSSNRGKT
jgi:hypothetical protein